MNAKPTIVAVDYDPSGPDVTGGERVVILNRGDAPLNMGGFTLRDAAPERPHVYAFGPLSLAPGAQVRVWTKAGADTPGDLFWGRGAAVWNNEGDVPTLRDPSGTEVSRFGYVPLPADAGPLKLEVPAFWYLEAKYDKHWKGLFDAGPAVGVVVVSGDWPETAKDNLDFRAGAVERLKALPGVRLGYVGTRTPTRKDGTGQTTPDSFLRLSDEGISARVEAWYDQFGAYIHGIYFDEAAIPQDPGSAAWAAGLVDKFKRGHPSARAMILAGQAIEEVVVATPSIDWTLLWEEAYVNYPGKNPPEPYLENFCPQVLEVPNDMRPIPDRGTVGKPIPSWWKDPKYRHKIAHTIHNCSEPDRQRALALANERNAGNVFVMDARGGGGENYDHLPDYWEAEVREADSYYDFGLDPLRALIAASRFGPKVRDYYPELPNMLHAWPNFEMAWYASGHVRGTFMIKPTADAHVQAEVMPLGALAPHDIPAVWAAAHAYAQGHPSRTYETALPTFEVAQTANNLPGMRVVLLKKSFPGLTRIPGGVGVAATYQRPTFAEPGSVIRNVGRLSPKNGFYAAFPTFVPAPDDPITGRTPGGSYDCYGLTEEHVHWLDVPTPTYIQQL